MKIKNGSNRATWSWSIDGTHIHIWVGVGTYVRTWRVLACRSGEGVSSRPFFPKSRSMVVKKGTSIDRCWRYLFNNTTFVVTRSGTFQQRITGMSGSALLNEQGSQVRDPLGGIFFQGRPRWRHSKNEQMVFGAQAFPKRKIQNAPIKPVLVLKWVVRRVP